MKFKVYYVFLSDSSDLIYFFSVLFMTLSVFLWVIIHLNQWFFQKT